MGLDESSVAVGTSPDRPVQRSPGMGQPGRPSGFKLRRTGLPQALRILGCLVLVLASELWGRLADRWAGRDRSAQRRETQADRLVQTLGELRGVFAKAGQFGALRYDVVPGPLRERLARLQDRVPALPLAEIRGVIESELGAPLGTCFAEFEATPLGAASIAQAHAARLPDGRCVVVKVQYPWLEASLPADLVILRALLWLVGLGRRASVSRRRLFEEFAAGVRTELDFEREARAAQAIARNLAGDDRVVVPEIVHSHSSRRVLTMTHHPAVRINDLEALRRLEVDRREVLEILVRAYAKQVFVDGFFHADPHPGNLFVISDSETAARPRVLFVDFGLSKRLAPELRDEMRKGILALLSRDLEAFLQGMDRMGMIAPGAREGVARAVASMFERLSGDTAPLTLSGDRVLALKDEAKQLLEDTPGLQLPNDLLLYAKTLSHLFSLGAEIDPGVDLMRLSTPYLLRFLAERSEPV